MEKEEQMYNKVVTSSSIKKKKFLLTIVLSGVFTALVLWVSIEGYRYLDKVNGDMNSEERESSTMKLRLGDYVNPGDKTYGSTSKEIIAAKVVSVSDDSNMVVELANDNRDRVKIHLTDNARVIDMSDLEKDGKIVEGDIIVLKTDTEFDRDKKMFLVDEISIIPQIKDNTTKESI